jgi:hypothetical protein
LSYSKEHYKEILFTDENIFTVEETLNKQNDRVYARSSKEAYELVLRIERSHCPASVMVWLGDVTSLHFCEKGGKTVVRNYQRNILTNVVEPLNQNVFRNRPWIFQQDSAPAHEAKTMQQWLENHVPEFISSEHWPSASPDLNALDCKLWSVLEGMVCTRRLHNLESLKQVLLEAVGNFPMDVVHVAIGPWPNRLQGCIQADGGRFE